jgi:hypothetical protein
MADSRDPWSEKRDFDGEMKPPKEISVQILGTTQLYREDGRIRLIPVSSSRVAITPQTYPQ